MVDNLFTDALPCKGEANWFHRGRSYSTFSIHSASVARCSDVSAYMHKHFCTHTNTCSNTQTHTHTQCDCKRLTVLLKSVCKQMFGRVFSKGGKRLNKLHAEDQQCVCGWQTRRLKHTSVNMYMYTQHTCICRTSVQHRHTHKEYIQAQLPHPFTTCRDTHTQRRWKYNHSNNSYYLHTDDNTEFWLIATNFVPIFSISVPF